MEYLPPEIWTTLDPIIKSWDDNQGMSVRAIIQRLRVFHKHELPPPVQRALRLGGALGDVYHIGADSYTDSTRLGAAERLGEHVGPVIHKRRVPRLTPEIVKLKQRGIRSFWSEVTYRKIVALYDVCAVGSPLFQLSLEECFAALRNRLQAAVTNDILGDGWSKKSRQEEELVPPDEVWLRSEARQQSCQIESLHERLEIIRALNLSPSEEEIVKCLLAKRTYNEIAAHLGISKNTLRQHCHNIRKKIA
jgi:RNA polymerase sigma factor (sigma-70 family)